MAQHPCPPETSWCSGSLGVQVNAEEDSGLEDGDEVWSPGLSPSPPREESTTIFVAFKGNLDDADFQEKLDNILNGMPQMLLLGEE